MKSLVAWLVVVSALSVSHVAEAQPESGKSLRLVVGAAAGSTVDVRARWLADRLAVAARRRSVNVAASA